MMWSNFYVEVMEDAARVCIVLEYAEGGELYRLVTHQGKLKEETSAKTVFFQITSAISHIVSWFSINKLSSFQIYSIKCIWEK